MSTPPPDDAPKPEPPPPPPAESKPEPTPQPTRWKRFKLPVNRGDRVARVAPLPLEPRPKGTSTKTILLIIGLVIGLPIAGCLFFFALCAMGLR